MYVIPLTMSHSDLGISLTIAIFQLFVSNNQPPNKAYGGCVLKGIELSGDRYLSNLGMA